MYSQNVSIFYFKHHFNYTKEMHKRKGLIDHLNHYLAFSVLPPIAKVFERLLE